MAPISIQLYTVRDRIAEKGLATVLAEIADIGYVGVEGGADEGQTPEEFRKLVEDLGMVVSSTWGDLSTAEARAKTMDNCGRLGTNLAMGGFWIDAFTDMAAIEKTAGTIREAIDQFKAAGITFGLHNHWMEFEERDGALVMDHLVRLVPDLTLELDIYWCSNFGENVPQEMVAKFANRIVMLHVKDGPQKKGEPMTAVGQGTVDIPSCVAAADPRWLVVELDEFAGDMIEAVQDSYSYLVGFGLAEGR
jgi:sugar phosphate isomerase/epimerase